MTRPLRVLHLEDSALDAELVRHRLDAGGLACDILLAQSRDPFEAALLRERFDLIISDYNLPGYDGVTALQQAQAAQPDVPVILISGTVGEEQAVRCLQVGATDYLLKARLERLVPAVERAIQEAETRRTRRRAEAALAESEARKAAILDSVLDCIITMDADGTVIELNAAAERTFGYTKAEAIGRPLAELIIPPRLREEHAAGLAQYLTTRDGPLVGRVIEMAAVRSDGSEIPVELSTTAIHSGKAPIFTSVLRDITARKQADETRARLAAIVDSSDDAIFSMALDDTVLTWNAGAERLFGFTASEVIGHTRALLVPASRRAELEAALRKAARGEAGEPFETQRLRKDGSIVEISLAISPMTDSTGRVTSVSTIARDITNRKRAEERLHRLSDEVQLQRLQEFEVAQKRAEDLEQQIIERHQAGEALRTAEERMRFALEAAGVGIWEIDYTTGVHRWSETLEGHYGLHPGTFGGTFEAFVDRVHPDDREAVLETMRNAIKAGGPFSVQNRTIWPDGTVRWLNGTGRIQLGRHGEPVRAIGISLDVTERRTLEEQYQQAQKMEAIGRLAGGVAHDFNNLLTVILGNCELLLAEHGPDDPRRADIDEIQKAGTSAAGLTRQLLAFSRKEIIEPTRLDLNAVVGDMRAMLARLIREDVAVVLRLPPQLAPITADRGQLEQIVLNLAVNARDAMPAGGTLTIETASVELDEQYAAAHLDVKPGPYVALTVSDTGSGMTPQVQARVFEPFFTTKEIGKGTGLGLATVHGIVARSGGSVRVASEVGAGTSFTVYFPRAEAGEPIVQPPPEAPRAHAGSGTVLVVEDADGLRLLTRRLLQPLGYTVLVAANADEALGLCEQHGAIDVLLTDVVMPGTSGPELTRRLLERRPTLKVIYMSGYSEDAIAHHGVLNPGIAFLHKPFTAETLGRKIRDVLER